MLVPADGPDRTSTEAAIDAAAEIGFETAATPDVALDAPSTDYDALAQDLSTSGATFAASGLGADSTLELRRAAATAGVTGVAAWYCDARCYDSSVSADSGADGEYVGIETVPFGDRHDVPELRAYQRAAAPHAASDVVRGPARVRGRGAVRAGRRRRRRRPWSRRADPAAARRIARRRPRLHRTRASSAAPTSAPGHRTGASCSCRSTGAASLASHRLNVAVSTADRRTSCSSTADPPRSTARPQPNPQPNRNRIRNRIWECTCRRSATTTSASSSREPRRGWAPRRSRCSPTPAPRCTRSTSRRSMVRASGTYETDCGDPSSIEATLDRIGAPVHCLFNVAGVPQTHPADRVFGVNFLGLRHVTERVLDGLMDEGGADRARRVEGRLGMAQPSPRDPRRARDARRRVRRARGRARTSPTRATPTSSRRSAWSSTR